ncbi:hypothetical protein [Cupriavidus sp. D39]|uniref:hypothetical protein n=1 Tax=Cupriavidus sp. D39 TaxID=2997877 RepID=UPI00226EA29E|nr:hypothetical protein [Cupriavidus sp. D39]MCY0854057.1 hypothetical protein [Cupriavidus sp. D39]
MALTMYSPEEFPSLPDTRATSAQGIFLYYVYTGRNAWHSTWINRYNNGCMHASRHEAELYAETLRKEGTVLYIQELPALVVRSKAGCLIATQINNDSPLREYKPYFKMDGGTAENPEWGIHWLRKGADLSRIAASLRPTSAWWRFNPPTQDSVIVLASENPFCHFDRILTQPTLFRGFTTGSDYRLGWETIKRVISPEPVKYLERMFPIERPAIFPEERWQSSDVK